MHEARPGVKPEIQAYLDHLNHVVVPAAQASGFEANVINSREALANLTRQFTTQPPPAIARVLDATVRPASASGYAVPIRIFTDAPDEPLPVLVYLHGGGHMVGSVTVYDAIVRRLASTTGHVVVAPEYRLAPECPFPAGERDVATVLAGVLDTLDARGVRHCGRLSIAGDSAGGALCTAYVRDHCEDASFAVRRQVLIYPSVDYTMSGESIERFGRGYLLEASRIRWYFDRYFADGDDRRSASPLFGRFSPRMPATLLVSAGCDPLRDEGLAYADAMAAAGASCEVMDLPTMVHTFLNMPDLAREENDAVYARVAAFLNG